MGQLGLHCERGNIKHFECRKCMLTASRPCAFTPAMLEYLREENSTRPLNAEFSPSMLQGCIRQQALKGGDYYTDIYNAWPMERGSMSHKLFEDAPPIPGIVQTIREITPRLVMQVPTSQGMKDFSGQPDEIVIHEIVRSEGKRDRYVIEIIDYKSQGEITHDLVAAKQEHVDQINMYRLLVTMTLAERLGVDAIMDVQVLTIQYIDMKKPRRFTSSGALQAKGKLIRLERRNETLDLAPLPIYDFDVVEDMVIQGIEERLAATDHLPPPYTSDHPKVWMCIRCPMKEMCYEIADANGEAHSW